MIDPTTGCRFCATTSKQHDDECAIAHDSVERTAARLLDEDDRLGWRAHPWPNADGRTETLCVRTEHKGWLPAPAWLATAVIALLNSGEIARVPELEEVASQ